MRHVNRLAVLTPFDSGENAINPNAGILKISKQISDRYPFTIHADKIWKILMAFLEKLKDGTVLKDTAKVTVKCPQRPDNKTKGTYPIVDCSSSKGLIEDEKNKITNENNLTGTVNAEGDSWILPWGINQVCWLKLSKGPVKFLTAQLSGCGVLIGGDRGSPVVVHANESGENLSQTIHKDGLAMAAKKREIYDGLIQPLTEEIKGFTSDYVATWYPGTNYMGHGAVFGVYANSTWKIYGHACHGNQSTTEQIWPKDAIQNEAVSRNKNRCKCCYITTAVCDTLGMPDDCDELTTLRWFRDEVMERTLAGRKEVAEYYKIAPKIVKAINERPDSDALYRCLYLTSIHPAVLAVRRGHMQEAHALYCEMVNSLNRLFGARVSELREEEAIDAEMIARVKKMLS